ncbi:Mpo1-like protein [Rhodocista pekingensis]|uniref:Mpo1-like protein n=1 Tax=Rhodocista pekingensis TaxID=201185 RepID=A0ABW2KZ53_9PROT
MAERLYTTYTDFWPFYLREHSRPATRAFHYAGTALGLACVIYALVAGRPLWLLGLPLCGYFFAWLSHATVERNRPATFTYPLWSLVSDFRMFFLFLAGRLDGELRRAGVSAEA